MCSKFIYRHILQLPKTKIFTTRDMLIYGTRAAVDSAMSRMVRSGSIVRLARGVFVKCLSNKPTLIDIVQAKANAYRTTVKTHVEVFFKELNLIPYDRDMTFARVGHSTSFDTIHGRAYLRGVSQKKMNLVENKVGKAVGALWFFGKDNTDSTDVRMVTKAFGRQQKEDLWLHSKLMPAWLREEFSDWFPNPRIYTDP